MQIFRIGNRALKGQISLKRTTVLWDSLQARHTSSTVGTPDSSNANTNEAGARVGKGEGTPSEVAVDRNWIQKANSDVRSYTRVIPLTVPSNIACRSSQQSLRSSSTQDLHKSPA